MGVGDLLVWDQHFIPNLIHFACHVMSAMHVHEVEEAFVTPRVSTDGGLLPADGAALRARVFPSPWCSSYGNHRDSHCVARSESCFGGLPVGTKPTIFGPPSESCARSARGGVQQKLNLSKNRNKKDLVL